MGFCYDILSIFWLKEAKYSFYIIHTSLSSSLHGQRGSISGSSQSRKRKRSIKFSSGNEDLENDSVFLDQNGGTLTNAESGEHYAALTEITTSGRLRGGNEENPATQRDVEGSSGVEEVNVRVDAGGCDETNNERQETRVEEVEVKLEFKRGSSVLYSQLPWFVSELKSFLYG